MGHVKWWLLAAFVATFVSDSSFVTAKDLGRYGRVCVSTVKIHPTMTCDFIANFCKVRLVLLSRATLIALNHLGC